MFQDLADYYFQRGIGYAKTQQITKALGHLQKTTLLQEDHWEGWNLQGLCFYQLGEFTKAKEAWQKSLVYKKIENPAAAYLEDMSTKEFMALCRSYNQVLELVKEKNYKKAIKILDSKAFHSAKILSFQNLLGLCYYAQGKIRRALEVWRRALELDLDHPDTRNYIQEVLRELEKRPWFLRWIFG